MTTDSVHTIADIARLAGVSKATVSRALNDSPLIAAETKERIRAIAKEHRFQMNAPARRLSLKASGAVALVTYDYGADGAGAVEDSFMLELMSGISSALHGDDYDLLIIHVDPDDTAWPSRYLDGGRADGFILMACKQGLLKGLVRDAVPFVIWGISSPAHEFCSVTGDSLAGGRLATEHLLATGRRRIAFLGGPAYEPEVQQRYQGYAAALAAAGVELDETLVTNVTWKPGVTETRAVAAVGELLERAPDLDAIFANSDVMAIAALDALRERGRQVPGDVAVVGYDDIAPARHANPPLTTIRQNAPLAGRLLAEGLLQHLRTGAVTSASIPAELVVRESA